MTVSLAIEFSQLIFHLGSFEVDDLATNTVGLIGGLLASRSTDAFKKRCIRIVINVLVVAIICLAVYGIVHHQHMETLAHNNIREDGS